MTKGTIMSKNIDHALEEYGVEFIKNCIPDDIVNRVREEYDRVDSTLNNSEIPKNKPIVVLWTHVKGAQKRIATFDEMPELWNLIETVITPIVKNRLGQRITKLQLLESIIFNKPATKDNVLHWHQDVAYFPLKPNDQFAVWFPLEIVTKERGAMTYALKSHKEGMKGSTDLHTRTKFDNEDRPLIPENPEESGFDVRTMEMTPNDMLIHNGKTWHYSGANQVEGYTRRGVSIRFIINEVVFDPRPGQGAAFTKQIEISPGQILNSPAFPVMS